MHVLFHHFEGKEYGTDDVLARLRISTNRPRLVGQLHVGHLELDRLHHLANKTVGEHDGRIAILIGQLESEHGQRRHLLRRGRRQHQIAVTAVAAALGNAK